MGTRTRRSLASVLALGAVASAVIGSAGTAGAQTVAEPRSGGRVVVAAEQAPPTLNYWLICCTLQWTQYMVDNLLPDAYAQTPDYSFVPELLAGEAQVTDDPFTVTYTIKAEAEWSDGVPVSAEDLVFTWHAYKDRHNQIAYRNGYARIEKATVLDPKTVRFEFRSPYPDYKMLFQDVFPMHVLKGKDLDRAWRRRIPISAGPFIFKEFVRGSHLTLMRNENYWGDHPAYLDEVEFRFMFETEDQIDALEAGRVDVIYPTPQPPLAGVRDMPGIEVQTTTGLTWEHVDMHFKDPWLKKPFIRKAVATTIDREAIVDEVIRPIHPDAQVLQSILYGVDEPEYEAHFDRYDGDPVTAGSILEDHGCERDADGIYRCGHHSLRFVYYTTNNNPLRKHVSDLIREQLDGGGIEVEVRRRDPATVFGPRILVAGHYDLFNFAWVRTALPGQRDIWRCDGPSNFTGYCNEDVDALLTETMTEMDPVRRARLANLADEAMATDVASLPLYQRPNFLAYRTEVRGLVDNPTHEGFTWNLGDWWVDPPV